MYARWARTVRRLQPDCVIFGTKNSAEFADCRWVGNESGRAGDPCWATIDLDGIRDESAHIKELNHGQLDGRAYVPAEVDVSIRPSWFYHQSEDQRVKSVETLIDIYCESVGRNGVLLLNFAPDRRGLIPATEASRVAGLRKWIDATFDDNLAKNATITASHPRRGPEYAPSNLVDGKENTYYASSDDARTDTIIFDLGMPKTFDCLMIQEVIELGHRTTGWSVDYSSNGTDWTPIPEASDKHSIGHKWIVRFKPITATHVRLRITSGRASIALHTFGIYKQP